MLTMMVDNIEEAELCKIAEKFVQEIDHSQVDDEFDSFECKNCSSFLMVTMVDRTNKSNYIPSLMFPRPKR